MGTKDGKNVSLMEKDRERNKKGIKSVFQWMGKSAILEDNRREDEIVERNKNFEDGLEELDRMRNGKLGEYLEPDKEWLARLLGVVEWMGIDESDLTELEEESPSGGSDADDEDEGGD
ncbi:MAG: hypothetical protein CL912_04520 [Deltaproteobacteria bacterium]|nr:hypothetical protein [Deltaproteobacteria bacterium]|tara:strand:- start:218 stop:571 length:354 start_codon:yes stop_codon:yes gene_type:complete